MGKYTFFLFLAVRLAKALSPCRLIILQFSQFQIGITEKENNQSQNLQINLWILNLLKLLQVQHGTLKYLLLIHNRINFPHLIYQWRI